MDGAAVAKTRVAQAHCTKRCGEQMGISNFKIRSRIIEGPVHPGSLDPAHNDNSNCPCKGPEILSGFYKADRRASDGKHC